MREWPGCICSPTGPEPWDHEPSCPVYGATVVHLEATNESTYIVVHEGTIVETIIARGADAAKRSVTQPGVLYLRVGGQDV